jgi:hypothetical protein
MFSRINLIIWNEPSKLQDFTDLRGVVFNKAKSMELMLFTYLKGGVLTISLSVKTVELPIVREHLFMKVL